MPLRKSPLASEGQPILSIPFRLLIPREHYGAMVVQAKAELPNECCGLLAGGVVKKCPLQKIENEKIPPLATKKIADAFDNLLIALVGPAWAPPPRAGFGGG